MLFSEHDCMSRLSWIKNILLLIENPFVLFGLCLCSKYTHMDPPPLLEQMENMLSNVGGDHIPF